MSFPSELIAYNAQFFGDSEEFSTVSNINRSYTGNLDSIGTGDDTYIRQLEFDKQKLLRQNDQLQAQLEVSEQAYNELANQIENLTKDNVLASELKDENRRLSEVVDEKSQQVRDLTARLNDQKLEEQILEEKLSTKEYECLSLRERAEHLQNVASSQYICLESAQEEQLRQMAALSAFDNKVDILREKVESIQEKFEIVECRMKDLQDEIVFAVAEKQELEKIVHPLKYDRQQTSGCPLQVHRRSHSECFAVDVLPNDNISSNIAEELIDAILNEGEDIKRKQRGAFFTDGRTEAQCHPLTEEKYGIYKFHIKDTKQSVSSQVPSQLTLLTSSNSVFDQRPWDLHQTLGGKILKHIGDSISIKNSEHVLLCLSSAFKLLQPPQLHVILSFVFLFLFIFLSFCFFTSLLIPFPMQVSRIHGVELSTPFPFNLVMDKIITFSHLHRPPPQ